MCCHKTLAVRQGPVSITGCDSIISLLLFLLSGMANELATMAVRDPELLSADE